MLWPSLDERGRRLFASTEAQAAGYGGISALSRITGLPGSSIARGISELGSEPRLEAGRVRRAGAGRKRKSEVLPSLVSDLEALLEPDVRGDPQSPPRWTVKSLRQLATALQERGHDVSRRIVSEILHSRGYSLQGNKKSLEGNQHPDRDHQFHYINDLIKCCLNTGAPVVSVDTKKKELIGGYDNKGREWHAQKSPEKVQTYDFPNPEVPRAYPMACTIWGATRAL